MGVWGGVALVCAAGNAAASGVPPAWTGATPAPPPPPVTPAVAPTPPVPASLPWTLRPPVVANVIRLDAAFGIHDAGVAIASTLLGSVRIVPDFGAIIRVGFAHLTAGPVAESALGNVVLGLVGSPQAAVGWRIPTFFGVTIPTSTGGGLPEPDAKLPVGYRALGAGASARGSMDNMLFAANYFAFAIGAGIAYASPSGFSVQCEATVFGLGRFRGAGYEGDGTKANFTTGLHVGHTIGPVNLSLELRYQVWLSTPDAVAADPTKRETLSAGIGVRARLPLGHGGPVLRPGIAYFEPLDDPLRAQGYHLLVVDLPLVF